LVWQAVAVPAAVTVSGLAFKVEAKSDRLVRSIAGGKHRTKRAVAKRVAASKPLNAAKAAKAAEAAVAAD
jgi:hypothetical protein